MSASDKSKSSPSLESNGNATEKTLSQDAQEALRVFQNSPTDKLGANFLQRRLRWGWVRSRAVIDELISQRKVELIEPKSPWVKLIDGNATEQEEVGSEAPLAYKAGTDNREDLELQETVTEPVESTRQMESDLDSTDNPMTGDIIHQRPRI